MWRGTFMGNEKVRQQGRREMKEAAALRTYKRQHGSSGKRSGGGGLFGLGRSSATRPRASPKRHSSKHTPTRSHPQRQLSGQSAHRPSQSRRPSQSHRHGDSRHTSPRPAEQGKGAGVSRRGTSGSQAQKARAQVSANRQGAVRRPSGRR